MKQLLALSFILSASHLANANDNTHTLQLQDVFDLEYANQIDITDDGKTVYFVRNRMDIKQTEKWETFGLLITKPNKCSRSLQAFIWITRRYFLQMVSALLLYLPAMAAAKFI